MRLVLDTNIVLDVALSREPFDESASKLLALGYLGEFELWMGSSQLTDYIYVVSDGGKPSKADEARGAIRNLRRSVHIYATNEADLDDVAASAWDDLEDALVHQAALGVKADAIITRDASDFSRATVKTFDCDGFFDWMEEEHSRTYAEFDFVASDGKAEA